MALLNVKTSTQLNNLLKRQKKTKESTRLLFVSLWDEASDNLLDKVRASKKKKDVYVVNTFDVPHSTAIFRVSKLPALVELKGKTLVEDYLPHIYNKLT